MSSWKSWRQRRTNKLVIKEHEKEIPTWKRAASVLYERFINYSNRKLLVVAAFGLIGAFGLYGQGFRWTQERWRKADYTKLCIKMLEKQEKLIALIGKPIRYGWIYPACKDGVKDDKVDVIIPVEGKKTDGVIFLEAHKEQDTWVLDDMSFEFVDKAGGVVQIIKRSEL